ncbi:hypothetical protein [Streptomyces sp. B1I3]|uniref:hypothetical protein n=1 Tax=Streptomyces sp. B1I3 TaxID=3042264 RepID=UPI00277FC71F|nr:hypothetical protein [Streptomyces sp. B1I3]MDQ0795583.1 hypothetical protein [Streptomyces sp. B1I3]
MGAVADAITAELELLRIIDRSPGLAQLAITLAESVDDPGNATAQANAARELRTVMADLRKLAPVASEDDGVIKLSKKREERRARRRGA